MALACCRSKKRINIFSIPVSEYQESVVFFHLHESDITFAPLRCVFADCNDAYKNTRLILRNSNCSSSGGRKEDSLSLISWNLLSAISSACSIVREAFKYSGIPMGLNKRLNRKLIRSTIIQSSGFSRNTEHLSSQS